MSSEPSPHAAQAAAARPSPRREALAAALDAAVELAGAARVAVLLPAAGGYRITARRGFVAETAASLAEALAAGPPVSTWTSVRPAPLPALTDWLAGSDDRALLVEPLDVGRERMGLLALAFTDAAGVTGVRERTAALIGRLLASALATREPEALPAPASPPAAKPPSSEPERVTHLAHALTDVLTATVAAGDVTRASEAAACVLLSVMPGIDVVRVWLAEDSGETVRRVASVGLPADFVETYDRLPLSESVAATSVLRDGRMALRPPARDHWPDWLQEFARRADLAMVAHVPMHSDGRVAGVLTLGSREERAFTPEEEAFLLTLAGQLAGQLDIVRAHARAADEQRRLQSLIDTLPEGLVILDSEGRIAEHNQAAADIFQITADDALPDLRLRLREARDRNGRLLPAEELPASRARRGETVRAVEVLLRRPDGDDLPLLVNAGPLFDAEGAITGAVTVFQDISALKDVDRLKDEFINTVSHELRTPLTTMRGGALTLLRRNDRLDAETRVQLLRDIAEEAERLHQLVEDLLSLTRTRLGARLQIEPVRLHRLASRLLVSLGARLNGALVANDVPAALPLVDADEAAVEQILRNLLMNAAKHGPRAARIVIEAELAGDWVIVGVVDQGPGLRPAELERVFEPFFRSAVAVAASVGGAGLGLTVCQRLVALHGGRIWAENRREGGAAFRFTLPVAADTVE